MKISKKIYFENSIQQEDSLNIFHLKKIKKRYSQLIVSLFIIIKDLSENIGKYTINTCFCQFMIDKHKVLWFNARIFNKITIKT